MCDTSQNITNRQVKSPKYECADDKLRIEVTKRKRERKREGETKEKGDKKKGNTDLS